MKGPRRLVSAIRLANIVAASSALFAADNTLTTVRPIVVMADATAQAGGRRGRREVPTPCHAIKDYGAARTRLGAALLYFAAVHAPSSPSGVRKYPPSSYNHGPGPRTSCLRRNSVTRQQHGSVFGCVSPAAWDRAGLCFASGMGPPVRQLWDRPGSGLAGSPLPVHTRCRTRFGRTWEAAVAFREVGVHEIREVLRLWLRGEGLRSAARLARVDRKTVRRYVAAAVACGLDRAGGEGQLGDELLSRVAERVRPHRADGHGNS